MIEKINRSIEKQEELRDDLTDTAASMKKSTTSLISDKKALDALVKENQKRLQQISKEYEKDVKGTLQNLADSIGETSKRHYRSDETDQCKCKGCLHVNGHCRIGSVRNTDLSE